MIPKWEFNSIIRFATDFPNKGTIHPSERKEIKLFFNPAVQGIFVTSITVKTPVGNKVINVQAEGNFF